MNGSASGVVGEVAQSETFHDNTLSGERSIPVKLHAHDPIAKFAVVRRCLQEGILFRSGLSKRNGIHRLCYEQFRSCFTAKRRNAPRWEGFGKSETLIGSEDPS